MQILPCYPEICSIYAAYKTSPSNTQMSTKSTIVRGQNFHFYREVFDDDHVYLELDTTRFEAAYGRVTLPIPIHVWETIRHLAAAELDLVDEEDDALLARVERDVDKRIAEYQQALVETPGLAGLLAFSGCLPYGTADSPRADQISRGMEYYQRKRERQRNMKRRIDMLREMSRILVPATRSD